MAKIISSSTSLEPIAASYTTLRTVLVGAVLGVMHLGLVLIFKMFFSLVVAGDLAMVLISLIGIVFMIWQKISHPLILPIAVSTILWGISDWSNGLSWTEVVIWNVALFALSYLLILLVVRYNRMILSLLFIFILAMTTRIIIGL
jgi:hypothetical protein